MESCLYVGAVRHSRHEPVTHGFSFPLFLFYLDLDEIPDLFGKGLLWSATRPAPGRFRREDHLGDPDEPLAASVRALVEARTGLRPDGPIRLLTQLRYLGYGFNPVSFYYCFDETGRDVQAIVAEINNTPWGEQYAYVVRAESSTDPESLRFTLDKSFHVSPFMSMDLTYDWRFTAPGDTLDVRMKNLDHGRRIFDAALHLRREPLTARRLAVNLARFPLMGLRVIAGIYWQALKLWWKKCPVYTHPDRVLAPHRR